MTAKKQPPKKPLPAALAKNAALAAANRRKEVLASARADMALLREKLAGSKGFGDLVVRGLELSLLGAGSLVEIVTWVSREDALAWGREKTAALIDLAKATPANDTPAR